ncbi:MAG: hypothetical protein HOP16_18770 [Acidobacteria bacterium]|nr:hypothetical protein [Acidobacteriota bacterium]
MGIERGASWVATTPTLIVKEGYFTNPSSTTSGRMYDISSDGRRFLMIKNSDANPPGAARQIIVVQHFDQELKRLVPAK